jgi:hypothetical protein
MREKGGAFSGCNGLTRGGLPSAAIVRMESRVGKTRAAAFQRRSPCLRDVSLFRFQWIRGFLASGVGGSTSVRTAVSRVWEMEVSAFQRRVLCPNASFRGSAVFMCRACGACRGWVSFVYGL